MRVVIVLICAVTNQTRHGNKCHQQTFYSTFQYSDITRDILQSTLLQNAPRFTKGLIYFDTSLGIPLNHPHKSVWLRLTQPGDRYHIGASEHAVVVCVHRSWLTEPRAGQAGSPTPFTASGPGGARVALKVIWTLTKRTRQTEVSSNGETMELYIKTVEVSCHV